MRTYSLFFLIDLMLWLPVTAASGQENADENQEPEKTDVMSASTFTGLELRGIGPALMSGRISDIAIDPHDRSTWYVTVACGGVWKTTNSGTTWTPIFDDQGSYSIGCVAVDVANPLIVWVGTGENNSQRSVGYGDGIYKSIDGGHSFKKTGLEKSEHIGKILIDPRDPDVVYVAAQGPLWAPGGERGLYKTTDGGKEWNCVLEISENTGVSDIVLDPRDPDILYASSYQRRRHVWTLIDGGPEGAIYKSYDGGESWDKLTNGLPSGDVGRVALAVSPINPDVVYALIEAANDGSGFYRSADCGANWEKRGGYNSGSPQYYQEIYADPHQFDRVYSMDTWMMVTDDGGKTFRRVGEKFKHVDNHALAFDPGDSDYLLAGCDGGVYESFDRGATWCFKANLPVTQFYKVCVDNDRPFYNVYGGTQDNNSQGGPSRTTNIHGIRNQDWIVTLGGDGFESQVDPDDPDIVYSQSQYGGLARYDRKTGQQVDIQPQPELGRALRWNWDSALLISPHSHTRLYFGANILFRSDDRGNSWQPVSGDLTRGIDRNKLKVMDRVWSVDSVAKNASTSFFGTIVALSESPLVEGLIYAGTDDGLVQVTEDGGRNWRRVETFAGVPEMSYVADLEASRHDAGTVYALLNNQKMGDFKPYALVSHDRGRTWSSISGNLPERGSVWALVEDHVKPSLLFIGTEFGLYFTIDSGEHWIRLKGGLPTIAMRDLEIQRRENDLVCASFGRSFYILDDYTPLREVSREMLENDSYLFPVKQALLYVQDAPLGWLEKGFQGDSYFTAPNPPFGAIFTYYLPEELKTAKEKRQEAEAKIAKKKGDVFYPSWETLRAEDREEAPAIILVVTDSEGNVVRRLHGPVQKGFHRVAWNLRYPSYTPTEIDSGAERAPWDQEPAGPLAAPGTYRVQLFERLGGELAAVGRPRSFNVVPLGTESLPAADREALLAFEQKTGRLQRAVLGANKALQEAKKRVRYIIEAIKNTPEAGANLSQQARALRDKLADLAIEFNGNSTVARRNEPTTPGILGRVQRIVSGHWTSTGPVPETLKENYNIAARQFEPVLESLRSLVEQDLRALDQALEEAGAPWTPGRLPHWKKEQN